MIRHRHLRQAAALAACLAGIAPSARAQDGNSGLGQYGPSFVPLPDAAAGQTISQVTVDIATSSGDAARDEAALRAARSLTAQLVGRSYRRTLVDAALGRLVTDGTVRAVTQRPEWDAARGTLDVAVSLDLAPAAAEERAAAPEPGFPVIYQDDRTKLTFILGGGGGVYSDGNPWFGQPELFNEFNPLAGNLPGSRATWAEGYLEFGVGGATQVSDLPYFVFGAVSGLVSASRGQDIFTNTPRTDLRAEKGYVGVLYADRASGNSAQLSFGRQTWTLNEGFLISMVAGSSNAGERGATYLGPRNATDFTGLFTGDFGPASFAVFYIDPDELEELESNTTFAGANVGYDFSESFSADASLITIPTSDSTYGTPQGAALPREGTTTYGVHALYRSPTPDHIWLEGEVYQQSNNSYDMSAQAWYGTVGYIRRSAPWTPSISLRLASFSGDDPETETFERFDSLMSTGLGNWLQGISFGKVYRNANLNTLRVQANVAPRDGMNLTFTWHKLRADDLNNIGGNPALAQLSSNDIGDEFTAELRWAIDPSKYLQLVASRAYPGEALRDLGADEPWSTLQASLYFTF